MSAQIELRSRNRTSKMLKKMQSRGWLSVGFDNVIFALKACFNKFVDSMALHMAGILTPKQARSFSIYATAFIMALLMLIFCRELNLYCFRSVAKNDSVSASKNSTDNSIISNTQQNPTL